MHLPPLDPPLALERPALLHKRVRAARKAVHVDLGHHAYSRGFCERHQPAQVRLGVGLVLGEGAGLLESVAEKNAGALSRASDGPPRAAAQLDDASGARAVVLEQRPSADGADRVCKLSMWLQKSRLASRGRGYRCLVRANHLQRSVRPRSRASARPRRRA